MKLTTLAYVSEAARGLGLADLKHILRRSREHNFRADVTGYLVYDGIWFAQLLEGSAAALEATMARIEADERHHDIQMLLRGEITQRCFEGFFMGCANLAAPVHLDTSELRGVIRDFVGQRELTLHEVQAFFRLFSEFRTPEQAALLSL
ncbi:MAG TPA: BLUF domain-containing protein [Pseudomonadales bacterium]|nr:BLUF domain-containing protein [Pseudomonadales bacterium]